MTPVTFWLLINVVGIVCWIFRPEMAKTTVKPLPNPSGIPLVKPQKIIR